MKEDATQLDITIPNNFYRNIKMNNYTDVKEYTEEISVQNKKIEFKDNDDLIENTINFNVSNEANYNNTKNTDLYNLAKLFIIKYNYNKFIEHSLRCKIEKKNILLSTNYYLDQLLLKAYNSIKINNNYNKQLLKETLILKNLKLQSKALKSFKIFKQISANQLNINNSIYSAFKTKLNKSLYSKNLFNYLKNKINNKKEVNAKALSLKTKSAKYYLTFYLNKLKYLYTIKNSISSLKAYYIKREINAIILFLFKYIKHQLLQKQILFGKVKKAFLLRCFNLKKHGINLILRHFNDMNRIKGESKRKLIIFNKIKKSYFDIMNKNNSILLNFLAHKKKHYLININKALLDSLKEMIYFKKIKKFFEMKKKFLIITELKRNLNHSKANKLQSSFLINNCLINIINKLLFIQAKNVFIKLSLNDKFLIKQKKVSDFYNKSIKLQKFKVIQLLQTNLVIGIVQKRIIRNQMKHTFSLLIKNKITSIKKKQNNFSLFFHIQKKKSMLENYLFVLIKKNYVNYENKMIIANRFSLLFKKIKVFDFIRKSFLFGNREKNEFSDLINSKNKKRVAFTLILKHFFIMKREGYILKESIRIFNRRKLLLKRKLFEEWKKTYKSDLFYKKCLFKIKIRIFYYILYLVRNKSKINNDIY